MPESTPPLIQGLRHIVTTHEAGQPVAHMGIVLQTSGQFKNVLDAASDERSAVKSKDDFDLFNNSINSIRTVVEHKDGASAAIISRSVLGRWWT